MKNLSCLMNNIFILSIGFIFFNVACNDPEHTFIYNEQPYSHYLEHDTIYNIPYSNIQYMNANPDVDVEFNVVFNGKQDDLDVSIPFNPVNSNPTNPLIDATMKDDYKTVKDLLKNKSRNPDIQDAFGRTALHYAAANDNSRIANLLLRYKANPNIPDHDGWTPLHVAADQDSFATIQILLQNKANPLLENNDSKIPFDYARDDKIKEILLKR
ncbi:MAG: ankyrin repeat domain-containing protein [Candidatus Dependentiae bacterium]|nr:ankyrin repeat domain-containing protein [Candidatus Dependentiae bacterium]